MSTAFWICAVVTAISAFVSLGYSVAGLRGAEAASRTGFMYAFARSLALALSAVIAIVSGSVGYLAAVAIAMVIVQACDAVVGAVIRDRMKTIGPAATAALNSAAVCWLLLS